jgi:hypothetical protein
VEEERPLKRRDVKNEVSREDTRGSGSRIEDGEVRSPWLVRDVVTLEEYGAQSSSADVADKYAMEPSKKEKDLGNYEEACVVRDRELFWIHH